MFIEGQIQPPPMDGDPGQRDKQLCELLMCLLKNEALRSYFAEHGLKLDAVAPCFERYCKAITADAPRGEIRPEERREIDDALANPRWSDIELLREASKPAPEPPPA